MKKQSCTSWIQQIFHLNGFLIHLNKCLIHLNEFLIHLNKSLIHLNEFLIHLNESLIHLNEFLIHLNKSLIHLNQFLIHLNKKFIQITPALKQRNCVDFNESYFASVGGPFVFQRSSLWTKRSIPLFNWRKKMENLPNLCVKIIRNFP